MRILAIAIILIPVLVVAQSAFAQPLDPFGPVLKAQQENEQMRKNMEKQIQKEQKQAAQPATPNGRVPDPLMQQNNIQKQRAAEQKAAEQKAAEQKAAEQKAAEQKAAEQRAAEQEKARQKAAQQASTPRVVQQPPQNTQPDKIAQLEKENKNLADENKNLADENKKLTDENKQANEKAASAVKNENSNIDRVKQAGEAMAINAGVLAFLGGLAVAGLVAAAVWAYKTGRFNQLFGGSTLTNGEQEQPRPPDEAPTLSFKSPWYRRWFGR